MPNYNKGKLCVKCANLGKKEDHLNHKLEEFKSRLLKYNIPCSKSHCFYYFYTIKSMKKHLNDIHIKELFSNSSIGINRTASPDITDLTKPIYLIPFSILYSFLSRCVLSLSIFEPLSIWVQIVLVSGPCCSSNLERFRSEI